MLQIGKRHYCETCGIEALITKPSNGTLSCHGADMPQREPKQVASSD